MRQWYRWHWTDGLCKMITLCEGYFLQGRPRRWPCAGPQEGHFFSTCAHAFDRDEIRRPICLQCHFSLMSFSPFQSFPLRCCAPMCPAEAHAKFGGFAWNLYLSKSNPCRDYRWTAITPHQGCQSGFKNLGFRLLKNQKISKSPNFKFFWGLFKS